MTTNPVDIDILERLEADMNQLRKDVLSIQQNSADIAGMVRRMDGKLSALERCISDVKLDLATILKLEIIGQFAHQETRIENMIGEAVSAIMDRLDKIEGKG